MSKGSTNVPRMTAAASPIAMATTTQMIAAPKTSESVTGAVLGDLRDDLDAPVDERRQVAA